jgi:hypothetical protein
MDGDVRVSIDEMNEGRAEQIANFNKFTFDKFDYTIESVLTSSNQAFIQGFINSLNPAGQTGTANKELARKRQEYYIKATGITYDDFYNLFNASNTGDQTALIR